MITILANFAGPSQHHIKYSQSHHLDPLTSRHHSYTSTTNLFLTPSIPPPKMPLWLIYHPPTAFTSPSTKRALAQEITKIYTGVGLPAFYVNVLFRPVEPSSYFIGGEERPGAGGKDFIRVTVQHIARTLYVFFPLYHTDPQCVMGCDRMRWMR